MHVKVLTDYGLFSKKKIDMIKSNPPDKKKNFPHNFTVILSLSASVRCWTFNPDRMTGNHFCSKTGKKG